MRTSTSEEHVNPSIHQKLIIEEPK